MNEEHTKPYVTWLERSHIGKINQVIMELTALVREQQKEIEKLKKKEQENE